MKAEFVVAGGYCTQFLWMKQTLDDHGLTFKNIPIFCEITSTINLSKKSNTQGQNTFILDTIL